MSYLGTNKLGKMYLGNTAIGKAYLGTNLVFDGSGGATPSLPYDAEVEYLESSGTQYIETGIIPTSTTGIKVVMQKSNTTDCYYAGLRNDSGNTRFCLGTANRQYAGYGAVVNSQTTPISGITENYLNYLNDMKFTCTNGTNSLGGTLSSLSFTPAYNIRLFGSAGVVASYSVWSGKIYNVKISQGSSVVMNLIPVRVGLVGCMYDTIGGQLYQNQGTGYFKIGDDKPMGAISNIVVGSRNPATALEVANVSTRATINKRFNRFELDGISSITIPSGYYANVVGLKTTEASYTDYYESGWLKQTVNPFSLPDFQWQYFAINFRRSDNGDITNSDLDALNQGTSLTFTT